MGCEAAPETGQPHRSLAVLGSSYRDRDDPALNDLLIVPTRSVGNDLSPHIRFCAQRVGVRLADDGLRSGPEAGQPHRSLAVLGSSYRDRDDPAQRFTDRSHAPRGNAASDAPRPW